MEQKVIADKSLFPIAVDPETAMAVMSEGGADAMALYVAYAVSSMSSEDGSSRLVVSDAAKILRISEDRIRKARAVLTKLGTMSEYQEKDSSGKVLGNYIILTRIHTSQIPEGGFSGLWKNGRVENFRIYSTRTQTCVPARNKSTINNNNINNNNLEDKSISFCKEGVGEKLLLSYPDEKKDSDVQVSIPYSEEKNSDGSVLADARTYPAKTESEPYEVWEKRAQNFVDYWNEQTKKNYKVTKDLIDSFKSVRQKYGPEGLKEGISNYFQYCKENAWLTHRFAPYEFLKQKNGFLKYYNK